MAAEGVGATLTARRVGGKAGRQIGTLRPRVPSAARPAFAAGTRAVLSRCITFSPFSVAEPHMDIIRQLDHYHKKTQSLGEELPRSGDDPDGGGPDKQPHHRT